MSSVGDEPIADVARAIRDAGKSLPVSASSASGWPRSLLEERTLLNERPRAQHAAHEVRRRIGDESLGREDRGQDIAPPAAADQDLAAAVSGAFKQKDAMAGARREDRRHQPRGAGANDDDQGSADE